MKATLTLGAAAALLVAGCGQNFGVEDLTDPDIARVFATGASIEATIGAGFQTVHNAISNTDDQPGVEAFGLESYSSLNNFNLGTRSAIPRLPINNVIGAPSIFQEYTKLSKEARLIVNAMDALDALVKGGHTIGTPARDLRARSFGFFIAGMSEGWLALMYDSASIVTPGMDPQEIPKLSGAQDVAKAAIVLLDSALAIANNPAAASGFPLEVAWLSSAPGFGSLDSYKRLIRSYRARIRAGVARTPAQAAATDWAKVIDDAENGIQANLMMNIGGSTGWNTGMETQRYQDPTWSQMSMMYMGMADVSGNYATFISQDYQHRNGFFLVVTPDKRWPQGTTRPAQNAASIQATNDKSLPYIENRPLANDVTGDPWGVSFYTYNRWRYIRQNSNTGLFPAFMKAENDMLAAEGYIRTGNLAAAAAKIDLTRVANGGLPAVTGAVTTATQPVPGGSQCVPQVPQGNGTVACGNLMEAMKYEKRIETTYTGFGRFWIDSRGWGDLIEGTPLEFPVPYQEMQTRLEKFYLLGPGFGSAAAKGVYGF
ncbi:MAG TPA: hypothetical protein VGQ56_18730 [Gemmatimonadaceae bacterium]|jgi:hypothetical protein|nr:hypothetical protein [Gemmatimonadaceae bacterium]